MVIEASKKQSPVRMKAESSGSRAPLVVSQLKKKFGRFEVLKRLDLQVSAGAIHGLVGLNGSGKTTTLECILGMQQFDGGHISVLGHEPASLYRTRGDVVGIFDTPSLHPNITVRQVMEHARILCENPVRSPAEVEKLLGVDRFSDFKIRHLSLGNRRRASIAQALLGKPAFIVLDEPFSGLDAEGVEDVLALIKRLNDEEGTSFLLSSHQLPYLERICTHMAILHEGRIAVSDEVGRLLGRGKSKLYIRCDDPHRAKSKLAELPDVAFLNPDDERDANELVVEIEQMNSAEVNYHLVSNGVQVFELSNKRPSLASLFKETTNRPL